MHGLRVVGVVLVWGLWWEAEFYLRVGFGTVECSLGVCSVNVGAEGCVVGEWREGIQFSLVELGNCSVWGDSSRSARRS